MHPLTVLMLSLTVLLVIGVPISFSLVLSSLLVIWLADLPTVLADAWWIVAMPGCVIVLMVLAFNLIGDGLRDAFKVDVDVFGR